MEQVYLGLGSNVGDRERARVRTVTRGPRIIDLLSRCPHTARVLPWAAAARH